MDEYAEAARKLTELWPSLPEGCPAAASRMKV